MPSKQPPFVVIEALDAGGSQTQTDLLAQRCEKQGYKVLQLHFPQEDRATGRLIYDKFLLKKNEHSFTAREQALLYIQDFYSRAADIAAAISAQDRQSIVVSDRYCTSTFAYQTMGLEGEEWRRMFQWLTWLCYEGTPQLPQPGLVVFLDTPVAVSLRRLAHKKKDYFETEEKLTLIRDGYLKIAKQQDWLVLNSIDEAGNERTRQNLHNEIWQQVSAALGFRV